MARPARSAFCAPSERPEGRADGSVTWKNPRRHSEKTFRGPESEPDDREFLLYVSETVHTDLEDDDEDFACIAAPSSKKSRTQPRDAKEKKEEKKKSHKESTPLQKQAPTKRISLDDKLYQRDLEVALALSVKEKSANILDEQGKTMESENMHRRPPFSNCSVDGELLGLNQVRDDYIPRDNCRQRTAASKVPAHQKLPTFGSDDGEQNTDSEPESVSSEESEEDSDYSEGDDEHFAMEKKAAKGNKKKTRWKMSMPSERDRKAPKSKSNSAVSPVVSPSRITEQKSEPTQKMMSSFSEPVGRSLHTSSPVTDKKPKWIPPAASGSSNNSMRCLSVKSSTQCLRLGLSRLARVKPLHPSATSS